jgi:hypothetical protein
MLSKKEKNKELIASFSKELIACFSKEKNKRLASFSDEKRKKNKELIASFSNEKKILNYCITSNLKNIINNLTNFTDLPYYFNLDQLEI